MLEAIRQLLPEYHTFLAGEIDPVLVIQEEPTESWLFSIVTRLTPDSLLLSCPDLRHKHHYEDEVLLLADPQFASKLRQIVATYLNPVDLQQVQGTCKPAGAMLQ